MAPLLSTTLLRTQTDRRLVQLVQAGHEPAFTAIVERYRPQLQRYCRRILPEGRCDDALQQAFLQAWRALKRLRRHLAKELARLADLAEQTADKVGAATDTAELTESLARLRVTLRRFALLREALDETTAAFARVTAVYPRK